MATIKQVAQAAGVSFTTVSHVLNNTRPVSDEARRAVLRHAIDKGLLKAPVAADD